MLKKLVHLSKVEKIIVTFLSLLVLVSAVQIGRAFYTEHSGITPIEGGIYIEGATGKVGLINPLFAQYGSITHDLTQLVFSGLTKYDPKANEIVPDLAEFEISDNGKEYTFTIHENALWHDGIKVTADDVIYTYNTVINSPMFNGLILKYNDFSGMKVTKVDDRTVQFLLEKPDSFFLVKTIIGLLPEHALGHMPVESLEGSPFNQMPVGSGPFRFASMAPMEGFIEVTLEAFDAFYRKKPNISTIQIRIYPEFKDVMKRQGDFDGIRNVPDKFTEKILQKGRLNLIRYHLPQYVAAFINTNSLILKNDKVRLALQIGTDKESLVAKINQSNTVDTPLLEIDQSNWVHQFSINKANGALFETEWQLPFKEGEGGMVEVVAEGAADEDSSESEDETGEAEDTDEPDATEDSESEAEEAPTDPNDTSEVTFINGPNGGNDWQTTDKKVTITGTVPKKTKSVFVNDYELQKFIPGDPGWSYVASFEFANLKKGINRYDVEVISFDEVRSTIDSITIVQGTAEEFMERELEKIAVENEDADILPFRQNEAGEKLILRMIAPDKPENYGKIANILKKQWRKIGIGITIEVLENEAFQEKLFNRDYDLLIFGQNLGYNLDAYPYWHSTQAKEGGYNLSNFKNFIVDSLLDKARSELDGDDRKETLNDIQEIISAEVPAIFLYSPTNYFALSDTIQNTTFENLSTSSDRFARISDWYAKVDRRLNEDVGIRTFFSWLIKQF